MKRHLLFFILAILVLSCSTRPDSSEFLQPQVSECEVEIDGYKATYSCTVRGSAPIRTSGFAVSVNGGTETRMDAALVGDRMTMETKGLEPGANYSIRAYVSNGRNEVFGPQKEFVIEKTDPVVPIPDPVFKEYLLSEFDTNGDGQISMLEAELIYSIDVCTDNIRSLEGIEHFKNLTGLKCTGTHEGGGYDLEIGEWTPKIVHGKLTRVSLSANTELKWINLNWNRIVSLDLPKSGRLRELRCEWGDLRELDLTGLENLTVLDLSDNHSLSLDLPDFPDLMEININNDAFESVDISASRNITGIHFCSQWYLYGPDTFRDFPCLESINFCRCRYSEMDFSQNTRLMSMWFSDAQLEVLDLRNCPLIELLEGYDCYNLKTIYLHTGCVPRVMNFSVMPEIIYVD